MTVNDLSQEFMKRYAAPRLRPSTYRGYRTNFKLHILPVLGNKQISEISLDDLDELTERMVDGASDRGTTMHAYLAHRLNGGEPEDFELPDAYMDYAESVELFLSEHTITPWLIEEPLGCADYAGTPDLVCDFDGKPSILDYKFVSTIAKTKVGAQLQGYMRLCAANHLFVDNLYAVQFLRDGYRLYPVDAETTSLSFTICETIHLLKNKKHPRGCIE